MNDASNTPQLIYLKLTNPTNNDRIVNLFSLRDEIPDEIELDCNGYDFFMKTVMVQPHLTSLVRVHQSLESHFNEINIVGVHDPLGSHTSSQALHPIAFMSPYHFQTELIDIPLSLVIDGRHELEVLVPANSSVRVTVFIAASTTGKAPLSWGNSFRLPITERAYKNIPEGCYLSFENTSDESVVAKPFQEEPIEGVVSKSYRGLSLSDNIKYLTDLMHNPSQVEEGIRRHSKECYLLSIYSPNTAQVTKDWMVGDEPVIEPRNYISEEHFNPHIVMRDFDEGFDFSKDYEFELLPKTKVGLFFHFKEKNDEQ